MERAIFVQTAAALTIAMLLLPGCSTSNKEPSVTMMAAPAPVPVAKPAPPITKPQTNAPAPPIKPAPPIAREPEVGRGWVGIERWVRTNNLGKVRTIATGAQPKLELVAPAGRLEFAVGSQVAKWNGETFLLGFTPQIVAHEVELNGLDIQKSLLPLLSPRPMNMHHRVIVIDPGHGGAFAGTTSVVGKHSEKEYTLDWAVRLRNLLEARGWQVYLTRSNDVDIPLHERVAVADKMNADIFLSLHFNSGTPSGSESGVETYCMTPFAMPSNLTRGYVDDAYYNWPNNAYDRDNFAWAMRLHRSIVNTTGAPDRGVRRARFMAVLRTQRRPAVLIEGGYLSNRAEATLINTPEYRQKLAQSVANAFPTLQKP